MRIRPTRTALCQSCGMPLERNGDFGTDVVGRRVDDYCRHCLVDGSFVEPHISEEAMVDKCVKFVVSQGAMPPMQARALMQGVIPALKRWRAATDPVEMSSTGRDVDIVAQPRG